MAYHIGHKKAFLQWLLSREIIQLLMVPKNTDTPWTLISFLLHIARRWLNRWCGGKYLRGSFSRLPGKRGPPHAHIAQQGHSSVKKAKNKLLICVNTDSTLINLRNGFEVYFRFILHRAWGINAYINSLFRWQHVCVRDFCCELQSLFSILSHRISILIGNWWSWCKPSKYWLLYFQREFLQWWDTAVAKLCEV